MTGIIMADINAFDTLQDRVWADRVKKYNTGGDRWCSPIIHSDGRIAFPVEKEIIEFLTVDDGKVVTLTADWFPPPEEDVI